MIRKDFIRLTGCLLLITSMTGCSVESESWVNPSRVEVHDDQFTDTIQTDKIDDGVVRAIASYHYRYGNGPLQAAVSYDPASRSNTKDKAIRAANFLKAGLIQDGVQTVNVAVTASPATGDVSTTLVTFPAITATAPQGCDTMPGYEQPTEVQNNANDKPVYRIGCTVESLLARQVARPSDLLGKDGFEGHSDGRRQERVLSTRGYYGDKPNSQLQGESASSN